MMRSSVAGTFDGALLRSWVDGKVNAENQLKGETGALQNPLRWSNDCCGGRMLDGALDELVMMKRALSEGEIKQLMEKGVEAALAVSPKGRLATRWGKIKSQR